MRRPQTTGLTIRRPGPAGRKPPRRTAPQTSWPPPPRTLTCPGSGWPHETPDHHSNGTAPEYPWPYNAETNWPDGTATNWPDDAETNWPDGTATNWPDGTVGAASGQSGNRGAAHWPSATASSTHRQNGTGSSTNGQSGIGRAWPDETGNRPEDQDDRQDGYDRVAGDRAAEDRRADPDQPGYERLAMLCYLSVPFLGFLLPLVIYVLKGRRSSFARGHAAQALNLSITALLYTFCVLIVGTILALDTISVALLISVPLVAALWVATLCYVVRAGAAASRGGYFRIPAWICATIAR